MRAKRIVYTMAVASATAIGLLQTKGAAGALLINGLLAVSGVAILPQARHVSILCAADEHLINFTVTGTNRYGEIISESIIGGTAGTANKTTKNFKTVTGISIDAALTGNVSLGTADSMHTPWVPVSYKDGWMDAAYTVSSGGSLTKALQTTMGDVFNAAEDLLPVDGALGTAVGLKTATAMRLLITSYVSGSVTLELLHRRQ